MLRAAGVPFWRLSSFYFCYFAVLGAWMPYWNLYLEDRGFSNLAIGLLSAVVLGSKIIAPSLWGLLAERTGKHMRVIQLGSILTVVAFSAVLAEPQLTGMLVIVLIYSFFWNAVLPQFEAVTIDHLGEHFSQYSKIRLWGSVGFIAAVIGLGWVFEYWPIGYLPYLLLIILSFMAFASISVRAAKHIGSVAKREPVRQIIKRKEVLAFFAVVALQQFSHGPYYTFYSIYLEKLGYSVTAIGLLWSLGVVAEIVLFAYMHKVLPRYGIKPMLLLALLLSVLRWLLIGSLAANVAVTIVSQLLHAASFGVCHAVAVEFIRTRFGSRQGLGQALYSGVSFGLGGALGAICSGYLWAYGAQLSYSVAALASLIAAWAVWRYFEHNLTATIGPPTRTEML